MMPRRLKPRAPVGDVRVVYFVPQRIPDADAMPRYYRRAPDSEHLRYDIEDVADMDETRHISFCFFFFQFSSLFSFLPRLTVFYQASSSPSSSGHHAFSFVFHLLSLRLFIGNGSCQLPRMIFFFFFQRVAPAIVTKNRHVAFYADAICSHNIDTLRRPRVSLFAGCVRYFHLTIVE